MKRRWLVLVGMLAGGAWVWGADTKDTLEKARSNYKQSVAAHGAHSPEAKAARSNLRNARRNYHSERRTHSQNRHDAHPQNTH